MTTDSCESCPIHNTGAAHQMERRAFLRAAAGAAIASLGALGLATSDAFALPVELTGALQPRAGDRAEEKRYPIPAADGVSIDKDNSVIVARTEGKVFAFSLSCPHQNTALRWNDGDHEFQCPKHKSRYRPDGTFIEGRATRAMDRLAVKKDGATLVVDIDTFFQQDKQATEWSAAFVTV
jgi:Rieske Fe-S protein